MTYTVNIDLDASTIEHLNDAANNGANPWSLVACKSVAGPAGGAPTVWCTKTGNFMSTVQLSWEENDFAYVSSVQAIANGTIVAMDDPVAITANQTASYDGGELSVTSSGNSGPAAQNISIYNETNNALLCGLAQLPPSGADGSTLVPICVFPIDGNSEIQLLPRVTVLLMFTSGQVNTASVAEKAYDMAIAITLTGYDNNPTMFTVSFDKDTSWNFGAATWAVIYPPNAALAPILNPDESSAVTRKKAFAQAV
jgi:hypothetical protein